MHPLLAPWIERLKGCPQSPEHHAEGDVHTHVTMVVEALLASPEYQALGPDDQEVLLYAAWLHDVAKPDCTRETPEGITSRGHSRRGAIRARELLWRMDFPPARREEVAALVAHHMTPFFLIDDPDPRPRLLRLLFTTRVDLLPILARADVRGRICQDAPRMLDQVELFVQLCEEYRDFRFASEHSRVTYFRKGGDPARLAHFEPRCRVTVLSGLPGAGKDTWRQAHAAQLPCVSLDAWREQLKVSFRDDQGAVLEAARQQARELLREGRDFLWNSTNVSQELRGRCLGLLHDYQAEVRIVAIEAPWAELLRRNRTREVVVPESALERMLARWEPPDLTEAHQVISCPGL